MSIFGSTFKPYVIRQLQTRQALIGDGNTTPTRSHNIQAYTAGKAAWVKMSSFVNYNGDDQLARKYILEGGTLLQDPTDDKRFALRRGIGNPNAAYGGLGSNQLGLRPMPGIESVSVVNKGAYGSLRLTTIKFVAWDKAQLDDLEVLYMRAGYPVLVEWGWSMYMDTPGPNGENYLVESNNGHISTSDTDLAKYIGKDIRSFKSPTVNPFSTSKTQDDLYDDILRLSHQFSGNYDGMVGIIENFSYELMLNGSYMCTTILVSIGDTLDSIKMNRPARVYADSVSKGYKTQFNQLIEELVANRTLHSDPIKSYSYNPTPGYNNPVPNANSSTMPMHNKSSIVSKLAKYSSDPNVDIYISVLKDFDKPIDASLVNSVTSYMQLAYLVAMLKEGFNLFTSDGSPALNIELPLYDPTNKYKNKGNGLCIASVDSVSVNPSVCLIKNTQATWITGNPGGYDVGSVIGDSQAIANEFLVKEESSYNSKLGIIGNIYMNMQYVSAKFNDVLSKSEDGEVHMYTFIKALLQDVSKALGGINDFDIFVEDNRAVIMDKHYTELSKDTSKDRKFQINIFGNDTVVRGYKIVSKIFQSQVNMMAISAGSDRLNLGGVNSSTQNYFNQGLQNRLTGGLTVNGSVKTSASDIQKEIDDLALSVIDIRRYLGGMLDKDPQKRHFPGAGESVDAAATILNSIILNVNVDANYRSIIPLSVEITMDGLSGIAIGEVFRLNNDILPKEYQRKDLGFIVTAIHQNILRSDWTTMIGAYPILLDQADTKKVNAFASINLSRKIEIGGSIKNLADTQGRGAQELVVRYLQYLYLIKVYYENNLWIQLDNNAKNISYSRVSAGANYTTAFAPNGANIDLKSILGRMSVNADDVLLNYKDYNNTLDIIANANYGGTLHTIPILNPIIKDLLRHGTDFKNILLDFIQKDTEFQNIMDQSTQLGADILRWANEIYDTSILNGAINVSRNIKGEIVSDTGLSVVTIKSLAYDTNSSVGQPNFIQNDLSVSITVTPSLTAK